MEVNSKMCRFFEINIEFNYNEYILLNSYKNNNLIKMNICEIIDNYNLYGIKNNYLMSVNDFYLLYPEFDIYFYKKYYKELYFINDIEYLSHYHFIGFEEKRIYSLDNYFEINNIDINFLKKFNIELLLKNKFQIFEIISNKNNYLLSKNDFYLKYNNFNLNIFKLFNSINFNNNNNNDEIEYLSYWYKKHLDGINLISSIDDFFKYNKEFDIKLYLFLYNKQLIDENELIYWFNNKDIKKLIYSYDTFIKNIDDFMFDKFIEDNNFIKYYLNNDIIKFYIDNIEIIPKIYSIKIFNIKYPNFNLEEYKIIYNITSDNIFEIINNYYLNINKENIYISLDDFYNKNNNFDLFIYKYNLNKINIKYDKDIEYIAFINNNNNLKIINDEKILMNLYNSTGILYASEVYDNYQDFDINIYTLLNNQLKNYSEEDILIHFITNGLKNNLPYNISMINEDNTGLNLELYKNLNIDLKELSDIELIYHWLNNKDKEERIYSKKIFFEKYSKYKDIIKNDEKSIINWMKKDIYNNNKNGYLGREEVNNIYEVLIDLDNILNKKLLEKGISLIIRAKNEELNIKDCIESVVDLADEIIFVDNGSTDNTYNLVKEYSQKYNNIKLYRYNIKVSKAGTEHNEAINNKNPNTLGTFYNWCLSKATKINVFKWDADFLCIRNNFINIIQKYNLKERIDKFAIWFTGITLFENNDLYYINQNSFYNEFRIFSYKNNFCWYDGLTCEYTDPYIKNVNFDKKYIYNFPLFYELKRTSIDEFQERSSMIDIRDINDHKILNNLKENNNSNLVKIDKNLIYEPLNIIIYTPSLSFGGGNQFIIEIYNVYKSIGFNIKIVPININSVNKDNDKFNIILDNDIIEFSKFNIEFIKEFKPSYIIMNSDIPFKTDEIIKINETTKILFVTHSDMAYSNYFIQKFEKYIYKIITVNNYVIDKISSLLNINKNKFYKLINYTNLKNQINIANPINIIDNKINNKYKKHKKFGVISRFSEDKNIPMLIYSLIDIFKIYPDYKCYLVGTHAEHYDNYLKFLVKQNNLEKNIIFEGYQPDVNKYYSIFDFIILPSVSEGTPYNIIEALSMGLPVIVSDVGGNHELVKNNENGFIYEYTGIRTYEKKTVYITSYNEHLSIIGYIINDINQINNNYEYLNKYTKNDVILPFMLKCKKHNQNSDKLCKYCQNLYYKFLIFKNNMNKLKECINNMINISLEEYDKISENNKLFIKNNYNKYIYYNQLIDIIK